ncbi:hypothetical protein FJZ26_06180 [Candidatus Parvarchaeota archaeon]|nr:hypothetical protein [Candidatus Parvarchaeota archaeon]
MAADNSLFTSHKRAASCLKTHCPARPPAYYNSTLVKCFNGTFFDPDGPKPVTFKYIWYRNGKYFFPQRNLTRKQFNGNDEIYCQVTPFDGLNYGEAATSAPVKVLNRVPGITTETEPPNGQFYYSPDPYINSVEVTMNYVARYNINESFKCSMWVHNKSIYDSPLVFSDGPRVLVSGQGVSYTGNFSYGLYFWHVSCYDDKYMVGIFDPESRHHFFVRPWQPPNLQATSGNLNMAAGIRMEGGQYLLLVALLAAAAIAYFYLRRPAAAKSRQRKSKSK